MTPRPNIVTRNSETLLPKVLELRPHHKVERRIKKARDSFSTYEYSVNIRFFEIDPSSKLEKPISSWGPGTEDFIDQVMSTTDCLKSHRGTIINMREYVAALRTKDLPRPIPSKAMMALVDVERTYTSFKCQVMATTCCANVVINILNKDIELAIQQLEPHDRAIKWDVGIEGSIYPLKVGHRQEDIPSTKYELTLQFSSVEPTQVESTLFAFKVVSSQFRKRLPATPFTFAGPREEPREQSRSVTWSKSQGWSDPTYYERTAKSSKPCVSWHIKFQGMAPAKCSEQLRQVFEDQGRKLLDTVCSENSVDPAAIKMVPFITDLGRPQYMDQII